MAVVFWLSVALLVYTYFLYPGLLWLLTIRKKVPRPEPPDAWQSVTVVIAAYNEAIVISDKIENTLALDYPADRLQIVVVSDRSDDGTDEIAQAFEARGVVVERTAERSGKTVAQNAGVKLADGEILVFSDANSMYDPAALKELVRAFGNPLVGCACGELTYLNPDDRSAGMGEGLYWRYEQFLKRHESALSSLVGANGAIYALRRELFENLEPDVISDLVMPLRVWRRGSRVTYVPQALAYEHTAHSFSQEFQRRKRIIARSLNGLMSQVGVLNPLKGMFAFQVLSHKVLRWAVPFILITAFISSGLLLAEPIYAALFCFQTVFYAVALIGSMVPDRVSRFAVLYVPTYFCTLNLGALLGVLSFACGKRYAVWQPTQRTDAPEE
jgi:cellulose synthase/poly-beta-1,6-N-acetylglucosamine synthase-like glycosyltransferase